MVIPQRVRAWLLAVLCGCGGDLDGSTPSASGGAGGLAAPANFTGVWRNGGTEIVLSWTDRSAEETGFRVDVSFSPGDFQVNFLDFVTGPNVTSTVYATLPNTVHYIRVLAVTDTLESDPSNVIEVTTPDVPLPPFYPSALATGPQSVELRWVNTAGTFGNQVERSMDLGLTWDPLYSGTAVPGTVVWTDATVPGPETNCLYRVRSSGVDGPGGWSFASTVSQTNKVDAIPLGPANGIDDTGSRTSVAVWAGRIHVSHFNQSVTPLGSLLYTSDERGTFETDIVDDGHDASGFSLAPGWHGTSLAVDAAGTGHVVASTYHVDRRIRYVTNAGGAWRAETVDTVGGTSPKIAVSPVDGEVVLLWQSDVGGTGNLRTARKTPGAGTWTLETIANSGPADHIPWLGFDSAGMIHGVLVSSGDVWHFREEAFGTYWQQLSIFGQADHTSGALGPTGEIHVAFHDASTGELKYADDRAVGWEVETIHGHPGGNLGLHNAIALFPSGRIVVVYYNSVQGDLWGAWKDTGGSWQKRLLDSEGDVGAYASIAIDGSTAVVSSYDRTNGNLKLLRWRP